MLRLTESCFAGFAENLRHAPLLALHDSIVEIFKEPVQLPRQSATDAGLASAHKTDKENRRGPLFSVGLAFSPRTRQCTGGRARSTHSGFLFLCYFAARFLRWILPLKLRSTTVDDTAARPMVPTKALPWRTMNEVCCFG